jgi:hypothetical protein
VWTLDTLSRSRWKQQRTDDRLIAEAHAQGESPKLLAEIAGLSEYQIFKILRQQR